MQIESVEYANPGEEVPVSIFEAPMDATLSLTARIESKVPALMSGAMTLPSQSLKASRGGSAYTTLKVPPEADLKAANKLGDSELVIVVQESINHEERTFRVEILNEQEEE